MPYGDGIPKINCYSLTDFHDFDDCPFRFFVRHHLDKKYDIDDSSPQNALGTILDLSIKKFHIHKYYGCEVSEIEGLVRAVVADMKGEVAKAKFKGKNHFYEATLPFVDEKLITDAIKIFQDFYLAVDKKIRPAILEVGFCEWVLKAEVPRVSEVSRVPRGEEKQMFKLWGGPDTLEMGDDGIPEVVDYKSRQNIEKGKNYIDMDLMPKIYMLLMKKKLSEKGFKKARFKVRFWQDPKDESFYEEFDLDLLSGAEFLFLQKIERILATTEITFCDKKYCRACQYEKRNEFIEGLKAHGVSVMSGEEFVKKNSIEAELDELFTIS